MATNIASQNAIHNSTSPGRVLDSQEVHMQYPSTISNTTYLHFVVLSAPIHNHGRMPLVAAGNQRGKERVGSRYRINPDSRVSIP